VALYSALSVKVSVSWVADDEKKCSCFRGELENLENALKKHN